VFRDVKAQDAPRVVERMLKTYLAHRKSREEPFFAFTRRHEVAELARLFAAEAAT
jgi:ferredoxin-nitrite reductase